MQIVLEEEQTPLDKDIIIRAVLNDESGRIGRYYWTQHPNRSIRQWEIA